MHFPWGFSAYKHYVLLFREAVEGLRGGRGRELASDRVIERASESTREAAREHAQEHRSVISANDY